ncbi:hypothetical protein DFJ58DRAFT_144664 [Suillus subalutaceus]|uniref:uncharacterized protein n=1 Tax=Suillus subalutaceus TaxID=48586 RepID=UPI001B874CD9|nr:uncharacterized protein DFJ58DRAFT_144664 [Suillus subalutaceus]KAG1837572.1 hypothetical protein DFJ58DRAFT_144664 [Suillus subalutaceus]
MKGLLSLVLVSIALLQMTAAAPTASERSQDVEKRNVYFGQYAKTDKDDKDTPETETRDVEKRSWWLGKYKPDEDDDEVLDSPEA